MFHPRAVLTVYEPAADAVFSSASAMHVTGIDHGPPVAHGGRPAIRHREARPSMAPVVLTQLDALMSRPRREPPARGRRAAGESAQV
jgi:hypothetical protein